MLHLWIDRVGAVPDLSEPQAFENISLQMMIDQTFTFRRISKKNCTSLKIWHSIWMVKVKAEAVLFHRFQLPLPLSQKFAASASLKVTQVYSCLLKIYTLLYLDRDYRTVQHINNRNLEKVKKNLVLFFLFFVMLAVLHYAEGCVTSLRGHSASLRQRATQLLSKCCSGGEPLETLCPIWPAWDWNLKP